MTHEALRRQKAVRKTLAKFRDAHFSWKNGTTCLHLAHTHLRNMGRRPERLPEFSTAREAKRALTERGWSSVTEMLDSMLPRIAPAEMRIGDMCVIPGEIGMDAIFICVGPRALLGWRGDKIKAVVLGVNLSEATAAWRVIWRKKSGRRV